MKVTDERRMYSINLISYILSKKPNAKYEMKIDDEGKCYFVFYEDISKEVNDYNDNVELRNFLSKFSEVKSLIYNNRTYEYEG